LALVMSRVFRVSFLGCPHLHVPFEDEDEDEDEEEDDCRRE
jgi:hypothetical protein